MDNPGGGAHAYQKFSGFAKDVEWCAVCWKGGDGEVKHADDPIHAVGGEMEKNDPSHSQTAIPKDIQLRDDLSEWLMNLRILYGKPGSPIALNHNFHWAIVEKILALSRTPSAIAGDGLDLLRAVPDSAIEAMSDDQLRGVIDGLIEQRDRYRNEGAKIGRLLRRSSIQPEDDRKTTTMESQGSLQHEPEYLVEIDEKGNVARVPRPASLPDSDLVHQVEQTSKLMTDKEWESLSAESRFKINHYFHPVDGEKVRMQEIRARNAMPNYAMSIEAIQERQQARHRDFDFSASPIKWNMLADIDYLLSAVSGLQERIKELEDSLGGMVAAFDGDGYGDKSIVQTTRECALSVAIQTLGWDRKKETK